MEAVGDGWVRGSYQLFLEWLPEIAAPNSSPYARHFQSAAKISFPTAQDLLTSETTAGEEAFFFLIWHLAAAAQHQRGQTLLMIATFLI